MRTRIVTMLALALALASAAPAAKADPSTTWLQGLRDAVAARFDSIPADSPLDLLAERAALGKSLAALRAPSSSVVGDLRLFQHAAKPIEGLESLAATPIADELDAAYAAFRAYVAERRDALPAAVDALVSPGVREKAQQGLSDADGALVLADVAELPSAKAILLRKANALVTATSARIARATACRGGTVRPGRAYVACFIDDTPFVPRQGGSTAGADGGAETRVTVTGYGLAARVDALEISWDTGAFTGPGTYSLDGSSGALLVLMIRGVAFIAQSGEVVVTEFDPAARRIAGTFSGIVENFDGDRRLLTGGVFKTCYAIAKR